MRRRIPIPRFTPSPLPVKSSFDKSVNDLRDKRLLTFNSEKLTSLELTTKKSDLTFGKNNQGDWQIVKPGPYRADSFQVEELVRKLGDARMDLTGAAADEKKDASPIRGRTACGHCKSHGRRRHAIA